MHKLTEVDRLIAKSARKVIFVAIEKHDGKCLCNLCKAFHLLFMVSGKEKG